MTRVKAARIRVYFDADVLGLAKLLCQERTDFTYPGCPGVVYHKRERPACPIPAGAKDPDWIPIVSRRGWLIIGRDRHIQQRLAEINAIREHRGRMVNFAGEDAGNTWAQLELFMRLWRQIEPLCDRPGPFIQQATFKGGLRDLSLEPINSRPPRRGTPGDDSAGSRRPRRAAPQNTTLPFNSSGPARSQDG